MGAKVIIRLENAGRPRILAQPGGPRALHFTYLAWLHINGEMAYTSSVSDLFTLGRDFKTLYPYLIIYLTS